MDGKNLFVANSVEKKCAVSSMHAEKELPGANRLLLLFILTAAPVDDPENDGDNDNDQDDRRPKTGFKDSADYFTGRKGHCQCQYKNPEG